MLNKIRIGAAGVALVSALGMASAANAAASTTATATAQILDTLQLQVNGTSQLDFGAIAPNTGGSVTVYGDGTATSCGGTLVCTGTTTPVNLQVKGTSGQTVGVTLPTGASLPVTLTSGLNSMDITAFNVDSSTVSLDGNWDDFYVGGTLSVASGQAAGTYTGTFSVSVEYQ